MITEQHRLNSVFTEHSNHPFIWLLLIGAVIAFAWRFPRFSMAVAAALVGAAGLVALGVI